MSYLKKPAALGLRRPRSLPDGAPIDHGHQDGQTRGHGKVNRVIAATRLIVVLMLFAMPALAQKSQWAPLGCGQLTSLGTAINLQTIVTPGGVGVPRGSTLISIAVEGNAVRYRDDGTAPTASVGQLLPIGGPWPYSSNINGIQFVQVASGAVLDVCFYQ